MQIQEHIMMSTYSKLKHNARKRSFVLFIQENEQTSLVIFSFFDINRESI